MDHHGSLASPPSEGLLRHAHIWLGCIEHLHKRLWHSDATNPIAHIVDAFSALPSNMLVDAKPFRVSELQAQNSSLNKKKIGHSLASRPFEYTENLEKIFPSRLCVDYAVNDSTQRKLDPWEYGVAEPIESTPLLEAASFRGEKIMPDLQSAAHYFSIGSSMIPGGNPMLSPPHKFLWKRPRSLRIWQRGFILKKFGFLKRSTQHEKQCLETMHTAKKEGNAQVLKQLLCGGFAGVISRTVVAPLDLIKTHLITAHLLQGVHKSALAICSEILKQDGWRGLFRGNTVNCIRVAPNKAIELYVFELVRRSLNKEGHPLRNFAATIAGGAAGMAGTMVTYPLELIRTRLSVQPELYKGLVQALSKIAKEEGLGALYYGISPTLVGVFPYAATNYFVYDGLRTVYCQTTGHQNVPTLHTLLFGALAAAMSSTVTYPLEVARRQMQLGKLSFVTHKNTLAMLEEIFRHEGFLALYRGLGTTWLKLVPAAGISFVCYEAARIALKVDDASLLKLQQTLELDHERDT